MLFRSKLEARLAGSVLRPSAASPDTVLWADGHALQLAPGKGHLGRASFSFAPYPLHDQFSGDRERAWKLGFWRCSVLRPPSDLSATTQPPPHRRIPIPYFRRRVPVSTIKPPPPSAHPHRLSAPSLDGQPCAAAARDSTRSRTLGGGRLRSEERRVGKECLL